MFDVLPGYPGPFRIMTTERLDQELTAAGKDIINLYQQPSYDFLPDDDEFMARQFHLIVGSYVRSASRIRAREKGNFLPFLQKPFFQRQEFPTCLFLP